MHITELTNEERGQLLSVLRELEGAPVEQRLQTRRNTLLKLWIRKIGRGKSRNVGMLEGTVLNVSARGVGLRVRHLMTKGDKLLLPLRFREGGGWLVLCEVRNCRPLKSGGYRAGAYFVDRIEDPEGNAKVPMDWVL